MQKGKLNYNHTSKFLSNPDAVFSTSTPSTAIPPDRPPTTFKRDTLCKTTIVYTPHNSSITSWVSSATSNPNSSNPKSPHHPLLSRPTTTIDGTMNGNAFTATILPPGFRTDGDVTNASNREQVSRRRISRMDLANNLSHRTSRWYHLIACLPTHVFAFHRRKGQMGVLVSCCWGKGVRELETSLRRSMGTYKCFTRQWFKALERTQPGPYITTVLKSRGSK